MNVDMARLIAAVRPMAAVLGVENVEDSMFEHELRNILYGPREYWECAVAGLVTRRELAQVIVARLETWIMESLYGGDVRVLGRDLSGIVMDVEGCFVG